MGIKLGNLDISAFKVGNTDCKVYLGDTLLYSPTPPTPTSWVLYSSGSTIPSGTFSAIRISESVASAITEDTFISFGDKSDEYFNVGNVCSETTCTEYCCDEYDEETGECISESPECCNEECVSHDFGMIYYDQVNPNGTYYPQTFTDGYWTYDSMSFEMIDAGWTFPFDVELQA